MQFPSERENIVEFGLDANLVSWMLSGMRPEGIVTFNCPSLDLGLN